MSFLVIIFINNQVLGIIGLLAFLTFRYHRIVFMPTILIILAYGWWKIETPFWYLWTCGQRKLKLLSHR